MHVFLVLTMNDNPLLLFVIEYSLNKKQITTLNNYQAGIKWKLHIISATETIGKTICIV